MDVKTTFLNGNLTEKAYVTQSEGFTFRDNNKVCKLQRLNWNIQFDKTVKEFGFSQNLDESCVYKKVLMALQSFS